MSLARLHALAEAAVSALESGDYGTAIAKALACKPLLAITPELQRSAAGNSQSMAFRTTSDIDGFIQQCRQLESAQAAQSRGVFGLAKTRFGRADNAVDVY